MGHKTKIAKACLLHHEWVTENSAKTHDWTYFVGGATEEVEQQQVAIGIVKEEEIGTESKHSGGAGTSEVQNVPEQPKATKEVNHDKAYAMRHEGTAAEKQEIGAQLSAEARAMNATEV